MDMRESCTKLQTLQCMLLGWVISPVVTTDCEKNSLATFKRFAQEKRFSIECHSVERSWTGWFGASSVFRITPGSAFVCKSFLPHSNSRLPPSPLPPSADWAITPQTQQYDPTFVCRYCYDIACFCSRLFALLKVFASYVPRCCRISSYDVQMLYSSTTLRDRGRFNEICSLVFWLAKWNN